MNTPQPKQNEKKQEVEPRPDTSGAGKPFGDVRETENRGAEKKPEEGEEGDEKGGNTGPQSKASRKATEL